MRYRDFTKIEGSRPIPKLVPDRDYYYRFWTYLLARLTELDPWYGRFKPGNQKVSGWKTGKPGIGFWFRLRSRYLQATVTIEDTGIDRIEYYWNQLKDKQNSIDSELPIKPQWEPARGRITASRIGVKIPHSGWETDSWWDDVIGPIKEIMDGFNQVILPHIDALDDLSLTHFYAIQMKNDIGVETGWMGGITNHLQGRMKQHNRKFSAHPKSSEWTLELIDSIPFENRDEAEEFERRMLSSEIRAPNIQNLSSELFLKNPLEWANQNNWIHD